MNFKTFAAALAFVVGGIFVVGSIGCSKADDTFLTGPQKPSAPAPDTVDPDSTDSEDENSADTGPGNTSNGNTDPGPVRPPVTVKPDYRFFCDDGYPPYISSVSSKASSSGFGAGLRVGLANSNGSFDPNGPANLEEHRLPQLVSIPAFGKARLLFSAKPVVGGGRVGLGLRNVYVADTDVSTRSGVAKKIAREIDVDPSLQVVASREGYGLRTFGVSDQGKYLLIGTVDGYQLMDAVTLQPMGSVKVGAASRNVNPSLRESDMIFSVTRLDGSFVQTTLFSLTAGSSGQVRSSKTLETARSLRRPLIAVSPVSGESFAAIDSKNKIRVVSSGAVRASSFEVQNLPKKGMFSSAAAFWRDGVTGTLMAAVGFENIERDPTSGVSLRYKIVQVFVRVLSLDESKVLAMTETELDYPLEARRVIESGVLASRRVSLKDLRSSPDGREVFALFPGGLSSEIYRLKTNSFDRVSQYGCGEFSMGVEP